MIFWDYFENNILTAWNMNNIICYVLGMSILKIEVVILHSVYKPIFNCDNLGEI